ncbi:MAG TPA: YeeE/YedE thiosulfate transporter family protein [Sandaracinaceae bacterium]
MDSFTPLASTLGGALIGLAASLLLLANGRIAGISGIFAGLLSPKAGEVAWRLSFVAGLVLGGLAVFLVAPSLFAFTADRTLPVVAIGGLLVGVGVRLGDGCTSGHGVCGLSRLSPRALVATVTFIATGALTVLLVRVLAGGAA